MAGPATRLAVWASGHSIEHASEHGEVGYHARLGALALCSAGLAFFIGFSFVYFSASSSRAALRWAAAIAAGLGTSASVLSFDRYVLGLVPSKDSAWWRIGNAMPRVAVSVAIAWVAAWSTVPLLADGVITDYLTKQKAQEISQVQASPDLLAAQAASSQALAALYADVDAAKEGLSQAQAALDAELDGTGGTHSKGPGPVSSQKTEAVAVALAAFDQAQGRLDSQSVPARSAIDDANRAISDDIAAQKQEINERADDIFTRHEALESIGDTRPAVHDMNLLVTIFLIVVDSAAVLWKTFSPRSATDEATARDRRQEVAASPVLESAHLAALREAAQIHHPEAVQAQLRRLRESATGRALNDRAPRAEAGATARRRVGPPLTAALVALTLATGGVAWAFHRSQQAHTIAVGVGGQLVIPAGASAVTATTVPSAAATALDGFVSLASVFHAGGVPVT